MLTDKINVCLEGSHLSLIKEEWKKEGGRKRVRKGWGEATDKWYVWNLIKGGWKREEK